MKRHGRKVALVYDAIFPYVKGGGERRFFDIARYLVADGYDVHLYGMKYWDGPAVIAQNGVTLHGLCKARPLYTQSGRRSISEPLIFGLSCFKLFGERLDIIDCCGFPYFSLFPCRLVAWAKRKPLYATWHEVWGMQYWREYLGVLGIVGYSVEWLAMRLPSAIIAVSNETAERLAALAKHQKIYIAENGVDVDHIVAIEPASQNSDIIYTGRLAAYKHIDMLLESIALLKKENLNPHCLIVGDGPERRKLEQLAKQLGLRENVKFAGFIENHDDMIRHMKASKVFVLPSSREGFGLVAVEANAAGLPVITVDEPANAAKELITADNGFVSKLAAAELAAAIQEALAKPIVAEQCVAVARRYDWRNSIGKLEEVFA